MKIVALLLIGTWLGIFAFAWMDMVPDSQRKWNGTILGLLLSLTVIVLLVFAVRGWRAS